MTMASYSRALTAKPYRRLAGLAASPIAGCAAVASSHDSSGGTVTPKAPDRVRVIGLALTTIALVMIVAIMSVYGWRASFFACAAISFLWLIGWYFIFQEDPLEHPRLTQEEREMLPPPKIKGSPVPWGRLFKRMAPVTLVYFCYGWTLWLFLTWIPQYFLHSYHMNLKNSALFSSGVFLAGVLGDTLTRYPPSLPPR